MLKVYEDALVVDENDVPVGRAQMPDAYQDGKILRVVEVTVVNSRQKILLQKRGEHILAPGLWGFSAGGHVDHSDSYETAARRELEEEMSIISDEFIEYLYEYEEVNNDFSATPAKRFRKEFICFSDATPIIDNDEVVDYKWISIEELESEIAKDSSAFMPSVVKHLPNLKQKLADI